LICFADNNEAKGVKVGGIKSLTDKDKPYIEDFPKTAITALIYLFQGLKKKSYLVADDEIIRELNRIGRFTTVNLDRLESKDFTNAIGGRLYQLDWGNILYFCERAYDRLLTEVYGYDYYDTFEIVKKYFSDEINAILEEEKINFVFTDGKFTRRGRLQTRKAMEKVGHALVDDRLSKVRNFYGKAQKAFNIRPKPDFENCVKDAICALEACIEILTGYNASQNFTKAINQIKGNGNRQIPAPIAESLIKFYSYRGSAEGVGHAAIDGNRVNITDAEFVLSLVATYITYLIDIFPFIEDVPF
jgi:hypothetical protein